MRESPALREICSLDPVGDCKRIVFLDTFHEFPFDTTRALELAFFETFAVLEFWRQVGRRMGIREIPATLEELDALNSRVERDRFAPTLAGQRLARARMNVFLDWFPFLPKAPGARAISALLEEHVVEVLGLPRASAGERRGCGRRCAGAAIRVVTSSKSWGRPPSRSPPPRAAPLRPPGPRTREGPPRGGPSGSSRAFACPALRMVPRGVGVYSRTRAAERHGA